MGLVLCLNLTLAKYAHRQESREHGEFLKHFEEADRLKWQVCKKPDLHIMSKSHLAK